MIPPTICARCDQLDDPDSGRSCPCTAWRLAHPKGAEKPRKPRKAPVSARRPQAVREPARKAHRPQRAPRRDLWVPVLDVIAAAAAEHHHHTTTQAGAA